MLARNFAVIVAATVVFTWFHRSDNLREKVLLYTMKEVQQRSYFDPTEEELFHGALDGVFRKLADEHGDSYSAFIPQQDVPHFDELMTLSYHGVGIRFFPMTEPQTENPTDDTNSELGENNGNIREKKHGGNEFRVMYPMPDSPAETAGVRAGDLVIAVNGTPTDSWSFDTIQKHLRGSAGEKFTITVKRNSDTQEETIDIELVRAMIRQPTVLGDTRDEAGNSIFVLETDETIGYIQITHFTATTPIELVASLQSLPNTVRGLILDLRQNPGGFLTEGAMVANMFVTPTQTCPDIVTTRYRDGSIKDRWPATNRTHTDLPMVVMVDGNTASAAEIVAGVLQDFGRAKVVGSRSYGKGTVQEEITLPFDEGKIKLTTSTYWLPSGANINRSSRMTAEDVWGVRPDDGGEVSVSPQQTAAIFFRRMLRSHLKPNDHTADFQTWTESYLHQWISTLATEYESDFDEDKKMENKKTDETSQLLPFSLQGTAPYYDPQLETAVTMLRDILNSVHNLVEYSYKRETRPLR